MSIDALNETMKPLYLSLAIFPENESIPLSVIKHLWLKLYENLAEHQVEQALRELQEDALLTFKNDEVTLHNLQLQMIKETQEPDVLEKLYKDLFEHSSLDELNYRYLI